MNAWLYCFVLLLSITSFAYGAEDVITDTFVYNYSTDKDTIIIMEGAGFDNVDFSVLNPAYIINDGTISGSLTVCAGCEVYIENRGIYNAVANLGAGATITQVINSEDDINELSNIGLGYSVLVSDTNGVINWNNIVDTTIGRLELKLSNANIRMNQIVAVDNVTLDGDIFIYTDTIPNADILLFSHVSGNGVVYVVPDDLDALYSVETYRVTNNVFAHMVRSTDYARILNNDRGRFLNFLRKKSPNDKLLAKLDSAKNFHELNHIMSKSVRLHPIKLLQPMHTVYSHKMLETMHIDDDGLGLTTFGVFSNDMSVAGISPNLNIKLSDDLYLEISGRVSTLKYSDDINEYAALSYGGGADLVYNLSSNNFIRAYGGFDFSSFDSGIVFDGNKIMNNPNGYSAFLVGEFGHRFDFYNEYHVSPFVMMGSDLSKILNYDDLNSYLGIGADTGFSTEFDGIRYDYMARGLVRSDGGAGLELNISAWSVMDAAGIDLKGSAFYDNIFGVSYGVSLNGKFNF